MIKCTPASKRSRPLLGTFLEITLDGAEDPDFVSSMFAQAAELEAIFSRFDPASELSRLNAAAPGVLPAPSMALREVLEAALALWRNSGGAFNPFFPEKIPLDQPPLRFLDQRLEKTRAAALDLSGVAKGYIVDEIARRLAERFPAARGCVNAGGDLRFFGSREYDVELRLGAHDAPLARTLRARHAAVATSSLGAAAAGASTARYSARLRAPLTPHHTVVALAPDCRWADALTKVGLFAGAAHAQACATELGAQILVFNEQAELTESYGAP